MVPVVTMMTVMTMPTIATAVDPVGDTLTIVLIAMGYTIIFGRLVVSVSACADKACGTNNSGDSEYRKCNVSAFIKSL